MTLGRVEKVLVNYIVFTRNKTRQQCLITPYIYSENHSTNIPGLLRLSGKLRRPAYLFLSAAVLSKSLLTAKRCSLAVVAAAAATNAMTARGGTPCQTHGIHDRPDS